MTTQEEFLFTSESVSEGHPDKMADQISDAILDALLKQDKSCRVACETLLKTGMVLVAGEISTSAWVDMEEIVRDVVRQIGYNEPATGFDYESCAVITAIGKQSQDIACGVDKNVQKDQGAGDQGLMFGYACNETPTLMPAPIYYAHKLMRKQADLRKSGALWWLKPDAKCQITMRYVNQKPVDIDSIVFSTQHAIDYKTADIVEAVRELIIKDVIPTELVTANTKYFINPTGRFVVGGPMGDCGLTGRKIIIDTYGGVARHGGGAFSGKDPSKVDRSAAYAARYVAKNIVAAKLADKCEVQLSYAIGVTEPVSIHVDTFGTAKLPETEIIHLISKNFDLTPYGIIKMLDLKNPIYQQTAAYGHFGREDIMFSWEKTDKVNCFQV